MLIYHNFEIGSGSASNSFKCAKNKNVKTNKKVYKSVEKPKSGIIHTKVLEQEGQKKKREKNFQRKTFNF